MSSRQAAELDYAFERNGWTASDVKKLSAGDTLAQLLPRRTWQWRGDGHPATSSTATPIPSRPRAGGSRSIAKVENSSGTPRRSHSTSHRTRRAARSSRATSFAASSRVSLCSTPTSSTTCSLTPTSSPSGGRARRSSSGGPSTATRMATSASATCASTATGGTGTTTGSASTGTSATLRICSQASPWALVPLAPRLGTLSLETQ